MEKEITDKNVKGKWVKPSIISLNKDKTKTGSGGVLSDSTNYGPGDATKLS